MVDKEIEKIKEKKLAEMLKKQQEQQIQQYLTVFLVKMSV